MQIDPTDPPPQVAAVRALLVQGPDRITVCDTIGLDRASSNR